MENKFKSLASNTIIFAIGNFGSKIIMFFFLPLYTNVLTTAEYGVAEIVTTFSALFVPIISLSIGNAVLRFGLDKKNNPKSIIHNALVVNAIGTILMLSLTPLLSLYKPLDGYNLPLTLISVLTAFRTSLQYYAKATNKNKEFAIESIANTFVLAISNILLLVVFKTGINGYLYAQIISLIVSVLYLYCATEIGIRIFKEKVNGELLKQMLKFSIPMILNALSWWILHSTDKIMIRQYISEGAVGIYSVSSKIPSLINTVTFFFSEAWFIAAITDYDSDKDNSFYEKTFKVYNFILCGIVACILLVLKPFMSVYVGKAFTESWTYVPLLLIATLFRNYSDFFGAIITSAKKSVVMMITSFAGAVINIIVNACLIPVMGIQGAVIGTTISYIIIGMLRLIRSRSIMPFKIEYVSLITCIAALFIQSYFVIVDKYIYMISLATIILIILFNFSTFKSLFAFFSSYIYNHRRKNRE